MPGISIESPPDSGFDPTAKGGFPGDGATAEPAMEGRNQDQDKTEDTGDGPDVARLMQLAAAADKQAVTFAQMHWRTAWSKSYKSFRSEYVDNSKYKSADYRHRSKIFRPKTRIAVTKDLAAAAQTLFATVDAVSITAGDETDQQQVMNAELNGALVNYRLDRTSGKNAIPWFLTAMGARQDCQITGVCCSKSFWDFQERESKDGGPPKRIKDKPSIDLIPPENVGLDPAAHWTDPVQSGAYFYVRYPMHVQDVRNRMNDPRVPWKEVTDDQIWAKAKVKEFETAQVRRSREGGTDRLDNQTTTDKDLDVVWVVEWFLRTEDEDWNFWTLGTTHLLSDPVPTEKAYPWKGGERPYRIGYGNLEAHRIVPQSPVETLSPLQQEINDVANLSLDNLKQVIQPVALVKRGKKIDTDGLKRRYPVLFVDNPKEDVQWDRPPEAAASRFADMSPLNTDFDDLAGTFNGGSVANNRQVGETVGGMRLMSGAASAVSEFYVRLWVETWVEPVMADLSKLEAFYEDDAKILSLAKKRAPTMKKFGVDDVTDELLMQEVLVRVSAGTGSPDPMQKLAKIGQAIEMTSKLMVGSKRFASGEVQMNEEALINEIWGDAGVRDAFDRFFEKGPPMPQPGDEAGKPAVDPAELQDRAADRDHDMAKEKLRAKTKLAGDLIKHRAGQVDQKREHHHDGKKKFMDTILHALGEHHGLKERAQDRQIQAAQPQPAAASPF